LVFKMTSRSRHPEPKLIVPFSRLPSRISRLHYHDLFSRDCRFPLTESTVVLASSIIFVTGLSLHTLVFDIRDLAHDASNYRTDTSLLPSYNRQIQYHQLLRTSKSTYPSHSTCYHLDIQNDHPICTSRNLAAPVNSARRVYLC